MQRGDLKATYSATITGGHLSPVAEALKKHGYEIRVSKEGDAIQSIYVKNYDPGVASMVYGLFSIAGWRHGRKLELTRPRFEVS